MGEFLDKAKGKFKEVTEAISGHKTTELKDTVYDQKEKIEHDMGTVRKDIKELKEEVKDEVKERMSS